MRDYYTFKITKTYGYYGYPQAEYHYDFEGDYIKGSFIRYGNQGVDMPKLEEHLRKCNGYFWELHRFMKDYFAEDYRSSKIRQAIHSMGTDETVIVKI